MAVGAPELGAQELRENLRVGGFAAGRSGTGPVPPFRRIHVLPLQVKAAAKQVFEGWASTPAVDREGEVVLPTALAAALAHYMRNPLVTYAHDWLNPVGRTIEARASEAGLWVQMQLGRTARAREVWQLIEDRILRSLSIGFNAGPEDGYERDGVWYWTRIELLEIAVVPIPANPYATIVLARQLGLDPTRPGRPMTTRLGPGGTAPLGHAAEASDPGREGQALAVQSKEHADTPAQAHRTQVADEAPAQLPDVDALVEALIQQLDVNTLRRLLLRL